MKVILTKSVDYLGTIGDVVDVKNGYGRNYLIPKGFALLASVSNQAELDHHKRLLEKKRLKLMAHSEELAAKLRGVKLRFAKKVGDNGKLFGTVTTRDIAAELEVLGYDIPRKSIYIDGDIKALGEFMVSLRLPHQVTAQISVEVISDEDSPPSDDHI